MNMKPTAGMTDDNELRDRISRIERRGNANIRMFLDEETNSWIARAIFPSWERTIHIEGATPSEVLRKLADLIE